MGSKRTGSVIKNMQDKSLRDGRKQIELKRLAVKANENHEKSSKAWRSALKFARNAGDALCRAKRLHRKRGTWQPWLRENFEGSYQTARVYMRVSRQWNDADVVTARNEGDISSLNTFLAFTTKAKFQLANGPEGSIESEADLLRKDIVALFAARLKMVDLKTLEVIDDNSTALWSVALKETKKYLLPPHLWEALNSVPEEDDYPTEEVERAAAKLDNRAIQGVKRALSA